MLKLTVLFLTIALAAVAALSRRQRSDRYARWA
jgi:hypothetical protein